MGKRLAVYGTLLVLLCQTLTAWADTWLIATVASYHTDRDVDHCERNPGLGIEHDLAPRWRAVGGFYQNSYCRQTVYAGAVRNLTNYGRWHFGVMLGGATGYGATVMPIVMPVFAYEAERWGANLGVMPALDSRIINIIGLQLKVRF